MSEIMTSNYKMVHAVGNHTHDAHCVYFYCEKCGEKLETFFIVKSSYVPSRGEAYCRKHSPDSHHELLKNWLDNWISEKEFSVIEPFEDSTIFVQEHDGYRIKGKSV